MSEPSKVAALLKELAALSPDERAALSQVFGAPQAAAAPAVDPALLAEAVADLRRLFPSLTDDRLQELATQQIKRGRERKAAPPKATVCYFFEQRGRFHTDEITVKADDPDMLVKKGYYLPPRVVAVDEKQAVRLHAKNRNSMRYLGRSDGTVWAQARASGMSVSEAQAAEYEAMLKNPDMNIPPFLEKSFFAGRSLVQLSRGVQVDWKTGSR